jgi:hypothetical protein
MSDSNLKKAISNGVQYKIKAKKSKLFEQLKNNKKFQQLTL